MSDQTPSLNYYSQKLHDMGGIEQEAGEAFEVRIDELRNQLAAAQATIKAVKATLDTYDQSDEDEEWRETAPEDNWRLYRDLDTILSRADGAALEQVKADAWDEGYGSDTEVSTPRINPYRREGGTE